MIGSLIGAGLGIAGSIIGGIKASQAMKKARQGVESQRQKNQDWYDRRYNEDATQRASAQAILTRTEEAIKNRNRAAAGRAAVTGASEESVAAEKQANADAIAQATSKIAEDGDARKDKIEQTYLTKDDAAQEQLNNIEAGKASSIATATQGVASAAAGIGEMFDNLPEKVKTNGNTI
jgi:hypothetical protein